MSEKLRRMPLSITKRWLRIPFALRVFLCIATIFGVMWGTIEYVSYSARKMLHVQCLAKTLDVNLDKFGMTKNPELFRQQAEAAARIHVKRVAEGKEFFCPPGNTQGKLELARQWILSSSKFWAQSERIVVVDEIARAAYRGSYKFEWPKEFECADEYKATKLRNPFRNRGHYVGSIGNMSIYCGGTVAEKL